MSTLYHGKQIFDVVSEMDCLERYGQDISSHLVDLLDTVLEKDALEPSADKRRELASLFIWLVQFEADQKADQESQVDQTLRDRDMRNLIASFEDRFATWAKAQYAKKSTANANDASSGISYDALLKKYNVDKVTKEKKSASQKASQ
ncbi:hypothetical protein AAL_04112 [Moelleriella libera RCEF 2490]|uniref:Uncharacterized protein n=1 Tax=Moelleriella libera RCEF 2490 TaxID=1081109 RepID=A0A168BW13_9HYPO|nr:hypothetical protein AAL_04112 [Moelleriella libera RCEF 2490]